MKQILIFMLCVVLVACSRERVDPATPSRPLLVAVLPDQTKDTLVSQYSPLLEYLERETSLELRLLVPSDYADLLDQFDTGRVDLAWFGGLTYTQAEQRAAAEPLAFRDVDLQFTSCYLARTSVKRAAIRDFEGESFGFGPVLSTSGHLMPRYFMTSDGLDPEQFFSSIRHSDGHDQTAIWVRDGAVALGVANCIIVQSMFDTGQLDSGQVHVIETTPPYSDYVWATRATLDQRIREALLDAFLALDASNPEHRALLRLQGANAYLPAGRDNFTIVRMAARQAGLLAEDGEN